MRIAQITDLHIGRADENTFDVDVRANFRRILSSIQQSPPDYIIATGDLCYQDPAPDILQYVKEQLDATGIPYFVIAGNHDNSLMLARCFGVEQHLHGSELYYQQVLDGQVVLFADTAQGELSATQKTWLKSALAAATGPLLLFMHHPPLLAGVPFMDRNYPLRDQEEVAALLMDSPYPVHVFCGHYHIAQSLQQANLQVHITPSNFFQIDPAQTEFAIEHHRIGFRDIHWSSARLRHRVVWVS